MVRGLFPGLLGAVRAFLWERKLYWMAPFLLVLVFFLVLIVLGAITGAGPFNYTLF